MAVYVDRSRVMFKEKLWCHLMADTLEELHNFAQQMNIGWCIKKYAEKKQVEF